MPQVALPAVVAVGLKPPSNQPHVTFFEFSRSPMLRPDMLILALPEQSSKAGSGSPITVPFGTSLEFGPVVEAAPCVWPLTRLIAPGVEGPNVVLYELPLM